MQSIENSGFEVEFNHNSSDINNFGSSGFCVLNPDRFAFEDLP